MVNSNDDGTAAHRLLSDLPLSIFENLISTPRAVHHHDSSRLLRQQILSKLSTEVNNDKSTHPAALSPQLTSSSSSSSSSITVRQLLKISELGLLRILDPLLTIVECRTFLKRVHNVCAAQSHSALQQIVTNTSTMRNNNTTSSRQYYNSYKIPTGLSSIDNYLHGGFAPGTITEVVGRAGVGKTHLAQQLCVLAASSSAAAITAGGDVSTRSSCGGGGSIFIDTENKLSLDRLNEIAINQCRKQEGSSRSGSRMNPVNFAQNVLENVTIRSLLSTKELLETLDELELEITERNNEATGSGGGSSSSGRQRLPVRLLVIDSIAAPIRRDFDMMMTSSSSSSSSIAAQRAAAIFQIARKLKELASNFNLAVVVINQVGAGGGGGGGGGGSNMSSSNQHHQRNDTLDIRDGEFTASLGTAWQYCVSTRIILEHDDDPHRQGCNHHRDTRTATIAKSLLSRRAKVEFQVTDEGLYRAM
ncbi:hypothetical protein ACHAWC_000943 [Mediolabrus comicus]